MNNATHVTTTPNKPLSPIESLKKKMAGDYMRQVTNYYGGNKDEALRFLTASIEYVRKVPKLLECDQMSLLTAMVTAAQFRFMPSSVAGEAYIIPYAREAKFQIGYQGIVTLLYRTGKVKAISANIVYANDEFDYEEGINPRLYHKPAGFGKDRGEAIGVYTVAQMAGDVRTFKVMDKDAVMGIKALSKAKAAKESPWNSSLDPELWMWKKTCLIQHAKLLPKTAELVKAIEEDYAGEGMDRGNLDAGGPAVGKTFHTPSEDVTRDDEETYDPKNGTVGSAKDNRDEPSEEDLRDERP